jgi:hypothetical protein
MNQAIPPEYRFLSLYKLLEMQFRRRGEWNEAKLQKYLLPLAPEFAQRGFKETPLQLLHEVRDKCAHVRTGKRREVLGVSELNHRQLVRVLKILPILGKACAAVLHDASSGQVTITTVDENDNWQ